MLKTRRRTRPMQPARNAIVADCFAGGGGASLGIELALGRSPHIAINHDFEAIKMHAANHPNTYHYTEDVFNVDPLEATCGRPVQLLWASPDCKHFSRAKGGKPVEKKIRSLAWIVVKWAKEVQPRVIMLENVSEFRDWGPLMQHPTDPGKWVPNPARKGETFKRWVAALEKLGYNVEIKVLNAADYGVTTNRKRLFMIARCDGHPIVWPTATHCKPDKRGCVPAGMLPYRTAAECIDWDQPCPSIFLTKLQARRIAKKYKVRCIRPLAPKTLWRMANGLVRYVINSNKPFIVRTGHFSPASGDGGSFRGQGVDDPLGAVCGTNDKALVAPALSKYYSGGGQDQPVDAPLDTVVGKDRFALNSAFITKTNHGGDHMRGGPINQPLHAITQHRGSSLCAPIIQQVGHRDDTKPGHPANEPLGTILSKEHNHLTAPILAQIGQTGGGGHYSQSMEDPTPTIVSKAQQMVVAPVMTRHRFGETGAAPVDAPVQTICAGGNHIGVAAAGLAPIPEKAVFVGKNNNVSPGSAATEPLPSNTTGNHVFETAAHLTQLYGQSIGQQPNDPMPTVTQIPHTGMVAANIAKMRGDSIGADVGEPLPTITSGSGSARPAGAAHAMGLQAAHMTKFYGGVTGHTMTEPLGTVTAIDHHGVVVAELNQFAYTGDLSKAKDWLATRVDPDTLKGFWRVHRFLVKQLGRKKAPLPFVQSEGFIYLITDIGMRMLKPRELLNAQFTPELAANYQLTGSSANQVAKIGNSVCPIMAKVLIEANIPRMEAAVA
jgi:DNA (cytosine-5)-methyltransferase 1